MINYAMTFLWGVALFGIGLGFSAMGQDPGYLVAGPGDGVSMTGAMPISDISFPGGLVVAAWLLGRWKPTIRVELSQAPPAREN